MAHTVNVSDLVTKVRERSNKEKSNFVTDDEIVRLLDSAHRELYDLLVGTYEDYYVSTHSFTTTPEQREYALPTDFYKHKSVEYSPDGGTTWITLVRFSFQERNLYQNQTIFFRIPTNDILKYNVIGDELWLLPIPSQSISCRLYYTPAPKTLTTSATPAATETNTIDAVNGYDEYMVLDATVNVLAKQQLDPSFHYAQREEAKRRVMRSAENRDEGQPWGVTDMDDLNPYYTFGGKDPW